MIIVIIMIMIIIITRWRGLKGTFLKQSLQSALAYEVSRQTIRQSTRQSGRKKIKGLLCQTDMGKMMFDSDVVTHVGKSYILAVFNGHRKALTLFMLGFPASWPSSSSSSRSLSLSLPLPEALLADRGLSCSESDPEPEPESEHKWANCINYIILSNTLIYKTKHIIGLKLHNTLLILAIYFMFTLKTIDSVTAKCNLIKLPRWWLEITLKLCGGRLIVLHCKKSPFAGCE